jgi:hypothetical protein
MSRIIDAMIRGYAKGYLFGQMVIGFFVFLVFATLALSIGWLALDSYLRQQGIHDFWSFLRWAWPYLW